MRVLRALVVSAGCLLPLVWASGCDNLGDVLFGTYEALPDQQPPPDGELGGSGGEGSPDASLGGDAGTSLPGSGGTSPDGNGGEGAGNGSGAGGTTQNDAGASVDAGSEPPPNPASCGNACLVNGGACERDVCTFDCSRAGSCTGQVICPPNTPCDVRCGDLACEQNVICAVGSVCRVRCEGQLACAAEVICNATCDIECSGPGACGGGVGGDPRTLELECSGAASCGATTMCQGESCQIECSGSQSCPRVSAFATDNVINCSGDGACEQEIFCSGSTCTIECDDDACAGGIDCQASVCVD